MMYIRPLSGDVSDVHQRRRMGQVTDVPRAGAGNVSSAGSRAGQQAPSPGGSKKRGISSPVSPQVQAGHASYCSRPCLVPGVMKLQVMFRECVSGRAVACAF